MSDAVAPRRFPLVAMGFAVVAMVFAIAAVIVVLRRGDAAPAKPEEPAKPALAPISDRKVLATDVVRLQSSVDPVVVNGETIGLRIKEADLAQALGLEADDVITALSGRQLTRDHDIHDVVFNSSMMSATTLYVEVKRANETTLVRWLLDGDLRQARYGSTGLGSLGSYSSLYTPSPAPDPLLDTIERVDDTHAKIPRATLDKLMSDPTAMAKGARVVPAMRNGKPDGLKLYAIRPSSIYAKLNFTNGDTLHSVNGFELDAPDKALEAYTKLQKANELTFEVTRRGKPVTLHIEITK